MANSEKVKFGIAHSKNQKTVILIFLKNVIKRFKVIPHKNSSKITVPFVWLSDKMDCLQRSSEWKKELRHLRQIP